MNKAGEKQSSHFQFDYNFDATVNTPISACYTVALSNVGCSYSAIKNSVLSKFLPIWIKILKLLLIAITIYPPDYNRYTKEMFGYKRSKENICKVRE